MTNCVCVCFRTMFGSSTGVSSAQTQQGLPSMPQGFGGRFSGSLGTLMVTLFVCFLGFQTTLSVFLPCVYADVDWFGFACLSFLVSAGPSTNPFVASAVAPAVAPTNPFQTNGRAAAVAAAGEGGAYTTKSQSQQTPRAKLTITYYQQRFILFYLFLFFLLLLIFW